MIIVRFERCRPLAIEPRCAFNGLGTGLLLVVLPRIEAVFIITTSTVGFRTSAFPRGLAIVGYLFGLGMFVVPLLIEPALLIFPLWVGLMSAILLVRRNRGRTAEAEDPI